MNGWYSLLLAGVLLLPRPSVAAEITSVPPWLRGDLHVGYQYGLTTGSLVEENTDVGRRHLQTSTMTWTGVFSAGPGVAVFFELPHHLDERISFSDPHMMRYDPTRERGTMVGSPILDEKPVHQGAALDGVWFGVRGTPFSQDFPNRTNRATWLLEAALQTKNKDHFWEVTDGMRGAGTGGGAFRLHTAFSTTHHVSQPYLAFTWIRRPTLTVGMDSADGSRHDVDLEPADSLQIRAGTELLAGENPASGSQFSFDLRLGFGYQSWQTIPSGFHLPSVLTTSTTVPVTMGEYSWAGAGLGLYYRIFRYLQLDLVVDAAWLSPHRLEHAYDIHTGLDTLDLRGSLVMKILVR